MCIYFLMYIFYILHTASTDDVLLRNLAKVWMIKDELDNNCFSILTKKELQLSAILFYMGQTLIF